MASDGRIRIGVDLDDDAFKKGLSKLGDITKSGLKATSDAIVATSAVMGGMGIASIKMASDFEHSMAMVSTMFGDVNVKTDELNKNMLQLSSSTGYSAVELGDSLYNALSAGVVVTEDMGTSLAFMEKSAKLAKGAGAELGAVVDAQTSIMNAYKMETTDLDRVQKILIQTQNKGKTTVAELSAYLSQVTPTAAAMGVSFEQIGAAMATLTAQGTPTAQATTQLNTLFAELGKQGTIASKNLEAATQSTKYAGMSFTDLMNAGVPLNEVLNLMGVNAETSEKAMIDMFGSVEAGKAALSLAGENSEKYAENLEAMSTASDVVGSAYEKMSNTFQEQSKMALEGFKNLGIGLVMEQEGMLANMGAFLNQIVTDLNTAFSEEGTTGLITAVGDVLADIVLAFSESAPMVISSGVQVIQSFLQGINENLPEIAKSSVKIGESLIKGIAKILPEVVNTVKKVVVDMAKEIANINPIFKPLAETVKLLVNNLEYLAIAIGTTVVAFKAFTIITAVSKAIHALSAAYRVANVQLQVHVAMLGVARLANAADLATLSAKSIVVGALTGRVQLATAAQALWNIALNANPIGLVVTAVGLLVAGLGILAIATNEVSEEEAARIQRLEELKESTEELTQNVNDNIAAYENSVDSIKKSADASMAELGYVEDLANELSTLADENGNVEEANRGRVSFILNELNEALGKEYSMTGNQIDNYKDMSASIYDLIEAEKARIILSAYEDELTEAIKRQTAAKKEAQNAVDNLKIAQEETNKIVSDYINYVRDASGVTITQEQAIKDLENSFRGLSQPINEFKDEFSEQKEIIKGNEDAIKELGNAQQAFTETQKQYSDAYAAYAIGNVTEVTNSFGINEKLKQEIVNKSNDDILDMIIANNAEVERLEQEKSKAVDQALINGYQVQIETTREQGKLLVNEFEKTGQNCVNALAQKLLEKAAVDNAAAALALSVTRIVNSKFEIKSPSRVFMRIGSYLPQGLAIGITTSAPLAINSINRLSKDILSVATNGQKQLSEDRKKNNKELLLFQKESNKLELKDAQALLKAKIDAEKLSSEEQVYILDYITEKYELSATERLKIEKQKSDTLKKMQKEEFEYSKKWIKDKKDLNQLSLNEELLAYERMMKRYAEGTDERIEAEKNFLRVQEEIRKEDFNNSKKWIKNKKDLNQLSLAEELLAYERVMDRYEEGSEERIEAEKEYFRVKSEMSKKIEELEKSYFDAVEKRRNELMNFSGVFETITIEMSDTNFIESLESQIAALELYNDSLQELMERGLNEGIIDELKKLGPKSAGLLQELADSSDADLQKISDLYAEKFKLANEQATTESVEIKENVDKSIADMLAGVEDKFEASIAKAPQYGSGFVNNFNSGAKSRKPELINTATDLGQSASSGLARGILNGAGEVAEAMIRVLRDMIAAAMEELDSHSPSKKFIKIGMDVDNGLAIGIQDNMDVVEKASRDMVNAVNPEFTFKSHVIPPKMFPDGTKFTPDIMAGFTNVLKDIKIVVENTVQNIYPTPLLNGNQSNVVYNNTQKETVQNFYVPVDTPLQSYLKRRVGTT